VVLLHVVCAGEFLVAAGEVTVHCLFGRVDPRVSRRVPGRREGLVTMVGVLEAAWVALGGAVTLRAVDLGQRLGFVGTWGMLVVSSRPADGGAL